MNKTKKGLSIVIVIIALVLMASFVVAASDSKPATATVKISLHQENYTYEGQDKPSESPETIPLQTQEKIEEQLMTQDKIMLKSEVEGLENAYAHADDVMAQQRIQTNLERWQNTYQFRYEKVEAVEIDGEVLIKAQRRARFLVFEFDITDEYEVDDTGAIVAENRGFLSRLFLRKVIANGN